MGKGRHGKRSHRRPNNRNCRQGQKKSDVEKSSKNNNEIEFSDEEEVIDTSRVYPNSRNSYSTRPNPDYPGGTSYYNSGRNTRRSYPTFENLFDPPQMRRTTQNRPRTSNNQNDTPSQELELYRNTGYDSNSSDDDDDDGVYLIRVFRMIIITSSPEYGLGETMMNAPGHRNRRVRRNGRNLVRELARNIRS